MKRAGKILSTLRAYLAARRTRREEARLRAAWRRDATDPDAMKLAREMAERGLVEMAVEV